MVVELDAVEEDRVADAGPCFFEVWKKVFFDVFFNVLTVEKKGEFSLLLFRLSTSRDLLGTKIKRETKKNSPAPSTQSLPMHTLGPTLQPAPIVAEGSIKTLPSMT